MNVRSPSGSTIALAIVGAVAQFMGILLVASPDLVPGARWVAHRALIIWSKIESLIRRALSLPPRTICGQVNLSGELNLSGRLTAIKGTTATTLEERVEWLLRRDHEAQRDVSDLAGRIAQVEGGVTELLKALRDELKSEIAGKIAAAQADFRAAHVLGTALLVLGLVLTTFAALR